MKMHGLQVERVGGMLQASCKCGWEGIGRDRRPNSCSQVFGAHMYAMGARTAAQVKVMTGFSISKPVEVR